MGPSLSWHYNFFFFSFFLFHQIRYNRFCYTYTYVQVIPVNYYYASQSSIEIWLIAIVFEILNLHIWSPVWFDLVNMQWSWLDCQLKCWNYNWNKTSWALWKATVFLATESLTFLFEKSSYVKYVKSFEVQSFYLILESTSITREVTDLLSAMWNILSVCTKYPLLNSLNTNHTLYGEQRPSQLFTIIRYARHHSSKGVKSCPFWWQI